MTDIMGYADAISVQSGDTISFKVSCVGAPRYRARIQRLLSPEAGPSAPPFRTECVSPEFDRILPAREQKLHAGSWAMVSPHTLIGGLRSFTLQAMIWPTMPGRGRQAIMGSWSETQQTGFGLMLGEDGALEMRLGHGSRFGILSTGVKLLERKWYRVAASYNHVTGTAKLYQQRLRDHGAAASVNLARSGALPPPLPGPGPLFFAAWHLDDSDEMASNRPLVGGCFNGKIDRPRLTAAVLDPAEIVAASGDGPPGAYVVGMWDFSRDIPADRIRDVSANRLDGTLFNQPARAMTGHNWDGTTQDWRRAPAQYGAIHFHDDDMIDARWHTDFSFTVPPGVRSGCLAALLEAENASFYVVFFVRPPKEGPSADIVYLASTATYTVYCNNIGRFRSAWTEVYHGRVTVMDTTDMLLLKYPQLGSSAYDRHSDGSGVCYSSRLRPATNTRPTGRLWNYCVDLFVIDWLERSGLRYDIVTDEDVHLQGLNILRPYRVLVTGSHPEYDSLQMLDALEVWQRLGGRMMYMGGNGFYWRIAYHPEQPAIIEVRRGDAGTRSWDAEPGEFHHSFTGEFGGLWRRSGRPPNMLAGVGFISQGFDRCTYYRRTAASRDPRVDFIFAGIDEEILGDFGVMQGGAAGMEIDCADTVLGTPPHALVLASSENHSNTYEIAVEAVGVPNGMSDGLLNAQIRADMVFYETPAGGAVFSTGSIAYSASLGERDFDNPLATLTWNVLKRFADPIPFAMPSLE